MTGREYFEKSFDDSIRKNNMNEDKVLEKTEEQVRKEFVNAVIDIVNYWENKGIDVRDKLEGVAFSTLALIDGCDMNMPKFILAPDPHEDDKRYRQSIEADWFPENYDSDVKCNISGCLHDMFYPLMKERQK